ncbi:MAG: putative integral rane protein [Chthonomonadaceae bacterium]|nr:putative integral rane protein [Chthonomonadaceae bacterium]
MSAEQTTARIEAFSDGVFAVAITLLVLDIKVPPFQPVNPAFSLGHELLAEWPAYLAFVTSFLTILIMWINHHRVFGLIRRTDDRFLILNGLLLLCVTVIPFSTSLLAAYIRLPDARLAALVYAGSCLLMAVSFQSLWRYAASNGRLLDADHDPTVAAGITKAFRFGPYLYLIVFVLGFVSVVASVGLAALLAIFFTIPPRKHAALTARSREESEV